MKTRSVVNKLLRTFLPQQDPLKIRRAYHIPDTIKLNIELTKDGWLLAEAPDYPGLFTQAQTQQELLDMVNDAVLTYFGVPKIKADYVYNQLHLGDLGTIRYEAEVAQTA